MPEIAKAEPGPKQAQETQSRSPALVARTYILELSSAIPQGHVSFRTRVTGFKSSLASNQCTAEAAGDDSNGRVCVTHLEDFD